MKLLHATLAVALGVSGCAPAIVGGAGATAYSVAQERTTADALKDNEIAFRLRAKYLGHSTGLLAKVGVDVNEGRVLLTGAVPERSDKVAATALAWEVPGVRAVEDQLTVAEHQGADAYIADVMISNQVRYDLLTDRDVASVNYNVETVDRVVHLTGLARSRTELSRVIEHAKTTRGVERVVSHVLTIDDPRRFAEPEKG